MDIHANLGGATFQLRHALLVYGDGRQSYVTCHEPVEAPDGGAPVLGPARAVGTDFLRALTKQLGTSLAREILPPEVLVRTSEVTVWWTRPRLASMYFNVARVSGTPRVAKLTGKAVPHPPLVWRATPRGLWVRALAVDARPTAGTPLCAAPYYNVGKTGSVCIGTMRTPARRGLEALAEWESAFFGSEFTHPLPGALLSTHPKGFAGAWRELAIRRARFEHRGGEAPAFPSAWLAPVKQTLAGFVESEQGGDW